MDIDEYFVPNGYYLDVMTKIGNNVVNDFFYIKAQEWTNITPYELGAAVAALGTTGSWDNFQDSTGRFLLQPTSKDIIIHGFMGVSPSDARIYQGYPSNNVIRQVQGITTLASVYGYFTGYHSPYWNPGRKSEFLTLLDLSPAYQGYNPRPTSGDAMDIELNVEMMKYYVEHISEDDELYEELKSKKRRSTPFILGGIGTILDAPRWLMDLHKRGD